MVPLQPQAQHIVPPVDHDPRKFHARRPSTPHPRGSESELTPEDADDTESLSGLTVATFGSNSEDANNTESLIGRIPNPTVATSGSNFPHTQIFYRPSSIEELSAIADADPDIGVAVSRTLEHYLWRAETHRQVGDSLASGVGTELERAFVEYARATTLVFKTIRNHSEYPRLLTVEQRKLLVEVSV
jgi:hypothetical protein